MLAKQTFRLLVFLVLGEVLYEGILAQHCNVATFTFGWMLRRHTYKTINAELPTQCLFACRNEDRCQSFNFVISLHMCELNNRTDEARPEDFIPNPDRLYFTRDKSRVPLGSITELPAESCKEIKASEGDKVVSGKYWFDSIKPGNVTLAYCNMNTEEIDECTASEQLCGFNANCINTHGSFYCSCFSGFTGDGKTCNDVDECTSAGHSCDSDVRATCTNTIGSYLCSCNPGYEGDGKNCIVPSECQNYNSLTGSGRKSTRVSNRTKCDDQLSGWYRFHGDAGRKMPTSCVPKNRCNTNVPGWLNGQHPTTADGRVTRKVCFHWNSNCCKWSKNIQLRNCGDYFVYLLNGTPNSRCFLRYCGDG